MEWKKLVYPGISDANNRFLISDTGELMNADTKCIYKKDILRSGYYSVKVSLGSRSNRLHIIIHRAVGYTFLQNPNGYSEINHIDGNKLNNNISKMKGHIMCPTLYYNFYL